MFVNQVPLAEIASAVDVKLDTVRKYYGQWSQNPDINKEADFYKSILREGGPDRMTLWRSLPGDSAFPKKN